MSAPWPETSFISEAVCFLNEFEPSKSKCISKQLRLSKKLPTNEEETILFFSQCISNKNIPFLRYVLQYHHFSPRVAFYSSLNQSITNKFDFEPPLQCIQYVDFNLPRKSINDSCIIRPISRLKTNQTLNGYGVEFRPFRYSMEYNVKDSSHKIYSYEEPIADQSTQYASTARFVSPDKLRNTFFSFLSRTRDKLHQIRQIVENWPITASTVATAPEEDPPEIPSINEQTMVFNGRTISIDTFDPFTFVDIIREERTLRRVLVDDYGMTHSSAEYLASLQIKPKTLTIDIRDGPIHWVNDLEKDNRYKKYPTKLKTLFGALQAPPKIRRNLVNAIFIVDPDNHAQMQSFMDSFELVSKGYAVRLGLIMKDGQNSQIISSIDGELFDFLKLAKNSTIKSAFENYKGTKIDPKQNTDQWLETHGLKAPALWINGKLYEGEDELQMLQVYALEAIDTLRTIAGGESFSGDFLESILVREHAVTRKDEYIHGPMVTQPITKMSLKKMQAVVAFTRNMTYDFEDPEFPAVTALISCRQNTELVIESLKEYFQKPHRTPVRVAFVKMRPRNEKDMTILINGRLMSFDVNDVDWATLFDWMANNELASAISSMPESFFTKPDTRKDLHLFWSGVLNDFNQRHIERRSLHPDLFDEDSPAVISLPVEESDLQLQCVFDPLSHEFQKMAGFLDTLASMKFVSIDILLVPTFKSIPTSFYRHVSTNDGALFAAFNESITYSVMMEPPETWFVEQVRADVDLDNVLAMELGNGLYHGDYVLANLVVEGSAIEEEGKPCKGLQLSNLLSDTTVMENGYWQLKAMPGMFNISLASEWSKNNFVLPNPSILVTSFSWDQHFLRLKQIGDSPRNDDAVDDGKIHIFAVASGRLYERLAKIMMLSAMKNAHNCTVKFWLFRNFLSPQMRESLQLMSKKYPMEFELVTYRWPWWLRRQVEKQRVTWGNKILFLDVLFPLNLKRVIYVDADQTIRTNMRQLMTMDFGTAPYAFTPFCNSRKETEPFRFWKMGYWKNHLNGRPYHISALFAIDLKRFREMGAGDVLRRYYQSLSADAGSLANLDQDLPNYAQEKIPIHSLEQNWLWCESWCSDETMDSAKTIDLCNNPLTKRPKLEIAQTRIKEWPELDKEARSFEAKRADDSL